MLNLNKGMGRLSKLGGRMIVGGNKLGACVQVRHNTAPYVSRPGYGLGSMVPPGMIQEMEAEAAYRTKIVAYDKMIDELQATARELLLEKNALKNDLSDNQNLTPLNEKKMNDAIREVQEYREELMDEKVEAMLDLAKYQRLNVKSRFGQFVEGLGVDVDANDTAEEEGDKTIFKTFTSNVESPLDWNGTQIKSFPRANESIDISSHFFDVNSSKQGANTHADVVAKAVTGTSYQPTHWQDQTTMDKSVASSVHNNVTKTMDENTVESTLVLTAMATHKWVKQLVNVKVDPEKLLTAWNYYYTDPEDVIDIIKITRQPRMFITELQKASNEQAQKQQQGEELKKISMISEQFLGSAMVGLVHFIRKEETATSQEGTTEMEREVTSITATYGGVGRDLNKDEEFKKNFVEFAGILSSFTGSSSHMNEAARKTLNSFSQTGIDVVFNVVVQGYMPTMKSTLIKDSIKEFANFSPDKISMVNDASYGGSYNTLNTIDTMANTRTLGDVQAQGTSESNSGAMIQATIQGLTQTENEYQVLDYKTFMTAFDDYVHNAPKSQDGGIAVGMNLRQWTRADVLREYWKYNRARMEAELEKLEQQRIRRERQAAQRIAQLRGQQAVPPPQ